MEGDSSYDKISTFYNLISGPFESRYRKEAIKAFSPEKGESLLEIGFGTGRNLLTLAEAVGPEGHITGLDNSPKMYDITGKRIKKRNLSDRVSLYCSDALTCSLPENAFDGAFLSFTLETFSDDQIQSLLELLHSSLKRKSRLTVLSMAESDNKRLIYKLYLYSHRRFPKFVDCRPINVGEKLKEAGFLITEEQKLFIYGLPVTIISSRMEKT